MAIFSSIFINANSSTYRQCCWDLWLKYESFLSPYINVLAINIQNLQKNEMDIVLDIAIYQENNEAS